MKKPTQILMALAAAGALALGTAGPVSHAGGLPQPYRVLPPITHGKLTIFPVVAASMHDTSQFITLDDGIRSGEVLVTEAGQAQALVRRGTPVQVRSGEEVNRLVLINNSSRPLILLAGEIVTGGKQDRVIGKDRLILPNSDPVDLSVFCVEPGRWTGPSPQFGSLGAQMAQPSVRKSAMADKDQQKVWAEVRSSQAAAAPIVAGEGNTARVGSSYARLVDAPSVKQEVEKIAAPVERDYSGMIRDLRARNAVGVVAAVDGHIIWADIFASTSLLEKYWPKLVRSYAAEALLSGAGGPKADASAAQAFLDQLSGRREVVESEPGVFRHAETTGDGYTVFTLTALLPKTGFDLHVAKMEQ